MLANLSRDRDKRHKVAGLLGYSPDQSQATTQGEQESVHPDDLVRTGAALQETPAFGDRKALIHRRRMENRCG